MRKPRKNYTPVEKVTILRRHLIDRVAVSDLCDEYQLSPTIFYAWQKLFFENGAPAFTQKHGAIGYVAPADKLAGREKAIRIERDRKLDAARERRKAAREASHSPASTAKALPTLPGALR